MAQGIPAGFRPSGATRILQRRSDRAPLPLVNRLLIGATMRNDHRLTRREFFECGAGAGLSLTVLGTFRRDIIGRTPDTLVLANSFIEGAWSLADGRFRPARFIDHLNGQPIPSPSSAFTLTLFDGSVIRAEELSIVSGPRMRALSAHANASRGAERLPGRELSLTLRDASRRLEVAWRAELREGSAYIRQEITLKALHAPLPIRNITMVDLVTSGAQVTGTVKGSPIVFGTTFTGFEHPLSSSTVENDRVTCGLARELPLRPGAVFSCSSVLGVTRPGQLRREFLEYVERERAHPYRTFLHYNSWYDLGYFSKFSEPEALAVIDAFGRELHEQRGVVLSSYLFDDGWDDPATLWGFNAGFPHGFSRLRSETGKYDAAPGVWLSPWGGYGKPKADRIANGKVHGFETNEGGFALSGPVYYKRFRDTCLRMMKQYGVNQFKFDGTGNADRAFPGSVFDSDFDAAITLIEELRHRKPDLYVNLTTGTYPSPFWLRYADSIWRGGEDHEFAGVGSNRQRWITYRDADTYANVVRRGALYPLNSLMLHGMIYAKSAHNLNTDPEHDFRSEIRSYFGTGTQLQEMYVTPALLSTGDWDALAEAANWSRRNAATLRDTHWIGGDPAKLEPYGWASWSPEGGILTLRNPSDKTQTIAVDPAHAFELPETAPREFAAGSPWTDERGTDTITLRAGTEQPLELRPFEVRTLQAVPR
jgi:hypothetical protein